jgi:hypothetical protein
MMEPEKYTELKNYLTSALKTAKKLGLNVQPGGGYSMGYDLNNLPPYAVGLFGALSIVEGAGARCKLGLTFDQTEALEAGFNGCLPNSQNKKKKNRRSLSPDMELMRIGAELTLLFQGQLRARPTARVNTWENDAWDVPVKKPSPFGEPLPPHKKKAILGAKQKKIIKEMGEKIAQAAPQNKEDIVEKIMALADAIGDEPAIAKEIKQHEKIDVDDAVWKMSVEWKDEDPAVVAGNKHWKVVVDQHGEQEAVAEEEE